MTEPLRLTFDEARALLAKKGRRLRFLVEHIDSKLTVVDDDWTRLVAGASGLSGQVVARDEAAELRAENAQVRADLREYVEDGFLQGAHRQEDGGYSTGGISTYRDLGDWLVEHAGWTRREGGVGRMQVYDPPRRLAGGENEK